MPTQLFAHRVVLLKWKHDEREHARDPEKLPKGGGIPRDEKMCHVPTGALLNPWSPTQCYDLDPGDRRVEDFLIQN